MERNKRKKDCLKFWKERKMYKVDIIDNVSRKTTKIIIKCQHTGTKEGVVFIENDMCEAEMLAENVNEIIQPFFSEYCQEKNYKATSREFKAKMISQLLLESAI